MEQLVTRAANGQQQSITPPWLKVLAAAYPNGKVTRDTLLLFVAEFGDESPEVLQAAARRVIRSSKWFPSIAEFAQAVTAAANAQATAAAHELAKRLAPSDLNRRRHELFARLYAGESVGSDEVMALIHDLELATRPEAAAYVALKAERLAAAKVVM